MSLNPPTHRSSPPLGALFFSLLALAWCGFVAFPTGASDPCLTSGCAITKNISIAGISFWWIGGGYFFILSIICLRGMRYFAWRLSQLALFLDCLFLVVMFVTGPCLDCLVVAFFFAVTSYLLRPTPDIWFHNKLSTSKLILLPIWLGLFLGNCLLVANEVVPPFTLNDKGNSSLRVYFSPTCPACKEAIAALGDQVQLYPVVESENDVAIIIRMYALMNQGRSPQDALISAVASPAIPEELPIYKKVLLMIGLLRNKAAVLKQGFESMPLIEINGMPKVWMQDSNALRVSSFPHGIPPHDAIKKESKNDQLHSFDKDISKESLSPSEGSSLDFLDISELTQCGKDTPCPD